MIENPALPGQHQRTRPLGQLLDALARWLALAGGLVLVAITLLSAYSITMRSLFDEAVSSLALQPALRRDLHDLMVDLLHGMALGPAVPGEAKRLRSAVAWWLTGVTQR